MKIFTIGFTKKSANRFFELLRTSGARRVVDVRLSATCAWNRRWRKREDSLVRERGHGQFLHVAVRELDQAVAPIREQRVTGRGGTGRQWKSRLPAVGGRALISGVQRVSATTWTTPDSDWTFPLTPRNDTVRASTA